MPTYPHTCLNCSHEWEEEYGMNDPIPTKCPNCGAEGQVKRLIAMVSGRVEVQGRHEMRAHLKKQSDEARRRARTDENYLANALGEDKYHQSKLDEKVVKDNLKNL